MSKYTTEVRFICESYAGVLDSVGYSSIDSVLDRARSYIFDGYYPIFDDNYKSVLETKILKHYYTREICAESVGLWKHWLNTKMNEIMPYYNQLYESELLKFNPLYNFEVTRENNVTKNGTKEDTGETSETRDRTATRTGNTEENRKETGTGTGNTSNTREVTGAGTGNTSDSRETTGTIEENGTAKTNETGAVDKDVKDYYSDTPQGNVGSIIDSGYLTNARNIQDASENTLNRNSENSNTKNHTEGVESEGTSSYSNTENVEDTGTNSYTNNTNVESTGTSTFNDTEGYESAGTSKLNSVISNTEQYLETVKGKQGGESYSKMLKEFRDTFLNIDMMVIDELSNLFFNLW